MLGDTKDRVRFAGDRGARISFIPVDHVVQDMLNVVAAEVATAAQDIYHITGETISSVGEIADYLFELLELDDVLEITPGPIADPTLLERFFAKRIEFFSHYIRDERRFVRSLMPVRATAIDEVRKYINAENMLFQRGVNEMPSSYARLASTMQSRERARFPAAEVAVG